MDVWAPTLLQKQSWSPLKRFKSQLKGEDKPLITKSQNGRQQIEIFKVHLDLLLINIPEQKRFSSILSKFSDITFNTDAD